MIVNPQALVQLTVSGWKQISSTCERGNQLSIFQIATSRLLLQSIASGRKRKIEVCDGKWQQGVDMKFNISGTLQLQEKGWQNTPYEDCTCMRGSVVVMPAITVNRREGNCELLKKTAMWDFICRGTCLHTRARYSYISRW
jgi:hypothetical protein